jgi:LuxR family transcriptional activator of conjugal transfer of Ti plasmids
MATLVSACQEFIDTVQTADDDVAFVRVGRRFSEQLGFRWFAYLRASDGEASIVSSYPVAWTRHYVERRYHQVDPVVQRACRERVVFDWSGRANGRLGKPVQRRFFDEAARFGIKVGLTVPILGGFGRAAAFTLASDEHAISVGSAPADLKDMIRLIGFYFHAFASARLSSCPRAASSKRLLTQRQQQCLDWVAKGKTMGDIAVVLGISARTVSYHLENARIRLGASSLAQCIGEAFRRGLLS